MTRIDKIRPILFITSLLITFLSCSDQSTVEASKQDQREPRTVSGSEHTTITGVATIPETLPLVASQTSAIRVAVVGHENVATSTDASGAFTLSVPNALIHIPEVVVQEGATSIGGASGASDTQEKSIVLVATQARDGNQVGIRIPVTGIVLGETKALEPVELAPFGKIYGWALRYHGTGLDGPHDGIRVSAGDSEDLTNAQGQFSIVAAPGVWDLAVNDANYAIPAGIPIAAQNIRSDGNALVGETRLVRDANDGKPAGVVWFEPFNGGKKGGRNTLHLRYNRFVTHMRIAIDGEEGAVEPVMLHKKLLLEDPREYEISVWLIAAGQDSDKKAGPFTLTRNNDPNSVEVDANDANAAVDANATNAPVMANYLADLTTLQSCESGWYDGLCPVGLNVKNIPTASEAVKTVIDTVVQTSEKVITMHKDPVDTNDKAFLFHREPVTGGEFFRFSVCLRDFAGLGKQLQQIYFDDSEVPIWTNVEEGVPAIAASSWHEFVGVIEVALATTSVKFGVEYRCDIETMTCPKLQIKNFRVEQIPDLEEVDQRTDTCK